MKTEDHNAILAFYAAADQLATANLVELLTATVLRKLAPPDAQQVSVVTISPADIEETLTTHHFESRYSGDEMTIFLTPLEITSEVS